jgi:hypothetical protein
VVHLGLVVKADIESLPIMELLYFKVTWLCKSLAEAWKFTLMVVLFQ